MTVSEILAGGARLVRTQPKAIAIWGLLYLAAMGLLFWLMQPAFAQMMEFQHQALVARAQNLPPPLPPRFFGLIFLFDIALLLVLVAIFAAAVRAVAQGGDDPAGFLRFGTDEVNLIILGILLWLIGAGAMIGFIVIGVLIAGGLALALGKAALAVLFPLYLIGIAGLIWAEVRISLAGAYTVLRGMIVIREAWRATRGRFWTLFAVYLLISIAFIIVSIAVAAVTNPDLLSLYAGGLQPKNLNAILVRQQEVVAHLFGARMLLLMLLGAWSTQCCSASRSARSQRPRSASNRTALPYRLSNRSVNPGDRFEVVAPALVAACFVLR